DLTEAILVSSSLSRAVLSETTLDRARMTRADLSDTQILLSSLVEADLRGADLSRAMISISNLRAAILRSANLVGAHLGHSDLSEAILATEADRTLLEGAILEKTLLYGVDLTHVLGLTQSQLDRSCGDSRTRAPAGLSRPAHWHPDEVKGAVGPDPPGCPTEEAP
ncbi:MAG: pentapeptide repeat-containing protein, partial [Holophagales bacterium]|nr:pentapeptide repeat-containing protein [Holophagales bacterium]